MPEGPEPSPHFVVDSNVSLKWALDDEDAVDEARALRDAAIGGRFEMISPSVWLYEITNGLIVAVRRKRLPVFQGRFALKHLLNLGVRIADPEAVAVYDAASRYGIAAYDAAYVALAETLRAPFWTGDRRLFEAVRHKVRAIHWIGDYTGS